MNQLITGMQTLSYSLRVCAFICVITMLFCLPGCAPQGQAVGDTWQQGVTVDHDGVDRSNVRATIVSPSDKATREALQNTNSRMFELLKRNRFTAYYADAGDIAGQKQAVKDAVARNVSLILIENMGEADWTDILNDARNAGIVVALLGEGYQPKDDRLYAAQLYLDEQSPQAQPLGQALQILIDDRAHPRRMMVNLTDDMNLYQQPDEMEQK